MNSQEEARNNGPADSRGSGKPLPETDKRSERKNGSQIDDAAREPQEDCGAAHREEEAAAAAPKQEKTAATPGRNPYSRLNDRQKGMLLMIASAFLFAWMNICVRLSADMPMPEQIFFRNIISLLISAAVIHREHGTYLGSLHWQPLLTLRSALGLGGMLSLFYAAGHASQADVAILTKLSPFLITIWAPKLLKQKNSKIQIPCLLLAFAGAALVANPAFTSDMVPLLAAVLNSVFASGAFTLLAYFKNKVPGITVVMHFSVFCCVMMIPFMLAGAFVMPDLKQLIILLLIGTMGGLGQICLTYSYRLAPAAEVSIYNYTGIIFSILIAYPILGEVPPWNSVAGAALVMLASWVTYKYNNSSKHLHASTEI